MFILLNIIRFKHHVIQVIASSLLLHSLHILTMWTDRSTELCPFEQLNRRALAQFTNIHWYYWNIKFMHFFWEYGWLTPIDRRGYREVFPDWMLSVPSFKSLCTYLCNSSWSTSWIILTSSFLDFVEVNREYVLFQAASFQDPKLYHPKRLGVIKYHNTQDSLQLVAL